MGIALCIVLSMGRSLKASTVGQWGTVLRVRYCSHWGDLTRRILSTASTTIALGRFATSMGGVKQRWGQHVP